MPEMPAVGRARIRTEALARFRNRAFGGFLRRKRCFRGAVFLITGARAPTLALEAVTHTPVANRTSASLVSSERSCIIQ